MLWRSARHCWQITVALLHHGGNFEVRNFEETWCFFSSKRASVIREKRLRVLSLQRGILLEMRVRWNWGLKVTFPFCCSRGDKKVRRIEKRWKEGEKSWEEQRSREKQREELRKIEKRVAKSVEERWEEVGKSQQELRLEGEKRWEEFRRYRRAYKSWEVRRVEKSTEKSWEELHSGEKRSEELRRVDKSWEELRRGEKSWEEPGRFEALPQLLYAKLSRHSYMNTSSEWKLPPPALCGLV